MLTVPLALALALTVAADPADPAAALAALRAYGEVPSCEAQEVIVKLPPRPPEEQGGMRIHYEDHRHERRPVAKLPRLAGKSSAILPYLGSPNRRVARRALDLACSCPDAPVKDAVIAFARRNPCHRFAREAPGGVGALEVSFELSEAARGKGCEGTVEAPGFGDRLVGGPDDWKRWDGPEAQALAKKIDAGDRAATASAVGALESMDLKEVRSAMAGLAQVRTPLGWAAVARAFPKWIGKEANGEFVDFCLNLAPHLLDNVARAKGVERVDALVAILKAAPDVSDALSYISVTLGLEKELAARRSKEARDPANPPEVRRFFEGAEEGTALSDPASYQHVSDRVGKLFQKGDRAALQAFVRDTANSRLHRLLAGSYLAQLGDASGLDLFEDPESIRSSQAFTIKSELQNLLGSTKGPVRARVEKILKLYGEAKHPYEQFKDSLDANPSPPSQQRPREKPANGIEEF